MLFESSNYLIKSNVTIVVYLRLITIKIILLFRVSVQIPTFSKDISTSEPIVDQATMLVDRDSEPKRRRVRSFEAIALY